MPQNFLGTDLKPYIATQKHLNPMIGENQQLVTNTPVQFEK